LVAETLADRVERLDTLRDDIRPDAVARKNRNARLHISLSSPQRHKGAKVHEVL
jgi:hypothetical protein